MLKNRWGLHARTAFATAKTAMAFSSNITVKNNTQSADGKQIDDLLLLAAGPGTELIISAEGVDENEALAAILTLMESGFKEK